jgi:hypothetical protein
VDISRLQFATTLPLTYVRESGISALVFNKGFPTAEDEVRCMGIKGIQPYITLRIGDMPIESLTVGVDELDTHPGQIPAVDAYVSMGFFLYLALYLLRHSRKLNPTTALEIGERMEAKYKNCSKVPSWIVVKESPKVVSLCGWGKRYTLDSRQ